MSNPLHLTSPAVNEVLAGEVVAADMTFAKLKDIAAGETITGTPTVTYVGVTEDGAPDTSLVVGSFVANVFTPAAAPVVSGSIVQWGFSGQVSGSSYLFTVTIATSGGKTRRRKAEVIAL